MPRIRQPLLRAAFLVAAVGLAGCYSFAQPSYHPGDARQVLLDITRRGVTVSDSVAGGSACADPGLEANALHLVATTTSDPTPRDVYIYTFRSKSWDGSAPAVDACQAEFAAAHPDATITRLDIPTYRAFGADWSTDLTASLRDALSEAAQEGE